MSGASGTLIFNERYLILIEQIMHLLCLLDSLALVGHGTLWVSIIVVLESRNAHEIVVFRWQAALFRAADS